jgi:hypothetical protein
MQELVSEAWVRFAHDGDPNHPGLPTWLSFSPEDRSTRSLTAMPLGEQPRTGDPRHLQAGSEDRWRSRWPPEGVTESGALASLAHSVNPPAGGLEIG